jgi:hypothetical protein
MMETRQCLIGHGLLLNNSEGRAVFCRVCGYDWLDLEPIVRPTKAETSAPPDDIGAAWFGSRKP